MGHPAQSQHLVVLESKDTIYFNSLNVLLSKCYLILHNSLKLFGHSSSRIASENWDPVQEVSTNMPPCPAESMESHECGLCSGCICNHQLHVPMLRPRGGEGCPSVLLRPLGLQSRMATCRLRAGRWSRHPPTPAFLAKAEITWRMGLGLLTRLFGENTQAFLYSVKLHEEFQVLAGHLEFTGRMFSVT